MIRADIVTYACFAAVGGWGGLRCVDRIICLFCLLAAGMWSVFCWLYVSGLFFVFLGVAIVDVFVSRGFFVFSVSVGLIGGVGVGGVVVVYLVVLIRE